MRLIIAFILSLFAVATPLMAQAPDSEYAFTGGTFNLGAANSVPFNLNGGIYGVTVVAATYGSVNFDILGPDGTTYVSALNAAFTANGAAVVWLPAGIYKFVVSGASGAVAQVKVIPGGRW